MIHRDRPETQATETDLNRMLLCAHMLPPHQDGSRTVTRIVDGRAARYGLSPRKSAKEAPGQEGRQKEHQQNSPLPVPVRVANIKHNSQLNQNRQTKGCSTTACSREKTRRHAKSKKKHSGKRKQSSEPHSDMALYAGITTTGKLK